jgi:hypothetical protein
VIATGGDLLDQCYDIHATSTDLGYATRFDTARSETVIGWFGVGSNTHFEATVKCHMLLERPVLGLQESVKDCLTIGLSSQSYCHDIHVMSMKSVYAGTTQTILHYLPPLTFLLC